MPGDLKDESHLLYLCSIFRRVHASCNAIAYVSTTMTSVMFASLVAVVALIIAGDVGAYRALIMPFSRSHRSHLAASAATSSSSSTSHESVASQWMEEERRVEEEMDRSAAVVSSSSSSTATSTSTTGAATAGGATPIERVWEEMHGNYILRPPPSSSMSPPRAVIHFLGGAFLGAAPQLTYRYLLERLSSRGYLVVATPYQLSFDHLTTCDEIISKFELVAPSLARQYGAIPVVGVGHSCGALLHMLITSLFPDTPRAANALLSYNNRPVSEAIPVFEQLIVPAFSNEEANGSKLIKAVIEVMRQQVRGEVPSDGALQSLLRAIPIMDPLSRLAVDTLLKPQSDDKNVTTIIPPSIRELLTNSITQPTYNAISTLPTLINGLSLPELLNQTLDFVTQIPKLIDEVQCGARDFVPTPTAMSSAARRAYRCRRTLLLQFENDNLDDSILLEGYLREAESVMRMKRPMISINLERRVLMGNHLTPILGPSGGESWGSVLEESLGGLVGIVDGISSSSSSDGDSGGNTDIDGESSSSAKIVRERLGYEQVEKVVDALVEWLDEGSL